MGRYDDLFAIAEKVVSSTPAQGVGRSAITQPAPLRDDYSDLFEIADKVVTSAPQDPYTASQQAVAKLPKDELGYPKYETPEQASQTKAPGTGFFTPPSNVGESATPPPEDSAKGFFSPATARETPSSGTPQTISAEKPKIDIAEHKKFAQERTKFMLEEQKRSADIIDKTKKELDSVLARGTKKDGKTVLSDADYSKAKELRKTLKFHNKASKLLLDDIKGEIAKADKFTAMEIKKAKDLPFLSKAKELTLSTLANTQKGFASSLGFLVDFYVAATNNFNKNINNVSINDLGEIYFPEKKNKDSIFKEKLLTDDYVANKKLQDKLYNNFFTEMSKDVEKKNNYLERRYQGKNMIEVAKDEGAKGVAGYVVANGFASLPQSLTAAAMAYMGMPAAGIVPLFGIPTAGAQQSELREREARGEDVDYDKETIKNGLSGLIEGGSELLGSAQFGYAVQALEKSIGAAGAKEVLGGWFKTFFKTMGKGFIEEGLIEEGAASLANDYVDAAMGLKKVSTKDIYANWLESVTVGGFAGTGMGVVGGVKLANASAKQKKYREAYDAAFRDHIRKLGMDLPPELAKRKTVEQISEEERAAEKTKATPEEVTTDETKAVAEAEAFLSQYEPNKEEIAAQEAQRQKEAEGQVAAPQPPAAEEALADMTAIGYNDRGEARKFMGEAAKSGEEVSHASIDMVNLTVMNDELGHEGANREMLELALNFKNTVIASLPEGAVVEFSRPGRGDEFAVTAKGVDPATLEKATNAGEKAVTDIVNTKKVKNKDGKTIALVDLLHPKHDYLQTGAGYFNVGVAGLRETGSISKMVEASDFRADAAAKTRARAVVGKEFDRGKHYIYNKDTGRWISEPSVLGRIIGEKIATGEWSESEPYTELAKKARVEVDRGGKYERYRPDSEPTGGAGEGAAVGKEVRSTPETVSTKPVTAEPTTTAETTTVEVTPSKTTEPSTTGKPVSPKIKPVSQPSKTVKPVEGKVLSRPGKDDITITEVKKTDKGYIVKGKKADGVQVALGPDVANELMGYKRLPKSKKASTVWSFVAKAGLKSGQLDPWIGDLSKAEKAKSYTFIFRKPKPGQPDPQTLKEVWTAIPESTRSALGLETEDDLGELLARPTDAKATYLEEPKADIEQKEKTDLEAALEDRATENVTIPASGLIIGDKLRLRDRDGKVDSYEVIEKDSEKIVLKDGVKVTRDVDENIGRVAPDPETGAVVKRGKEELLEGDIEKGPEEELPFAKKEKTNAAIDKRRRNDRNLPGTKEAASAKDALDELANNLTAEGEPKEVARLVPFKALSRKQKAAQALVRSHAGMPVVWYSSNSPQFVSGDGVTYKGHVFLNVRNHTPILAVAFHEIFHIMKMKHPDLYRELRSTFLSTARTDWRQQFRRLVIDKYGAEEWARIVKNDTVNDAVMNEALGHFTGQMATTRAFWSKLYEKSPEAVQKVLDLLNEFLDELTGHRMFYNVQPLVADVAMMRDAIAFAMGRMSAREQAIRRRRLNTVKSGDIAFAKAGPGQRDMFGLDLLDQLEEVTPKEKALYDKTTADLFGRSAGEEAVAEEKTRREKEDKEKAAQDKGLEGSDLKDGLEGGGQLALFARKRQILYRGATKKTGIYQMGKGLYLTKTKTKAKQYGKVEAYTNAYPENPLIINRGENFIDWLLQESGERNLRGFNKKYKIEEFVKSKGHDGVVNEDLDEVVNYAPPETLTKKTDTNVPHFARVPGVTPEQREKNLEKFMEGKKLVADTAERYMAAINKYRKYKDPEIYYHYSNNPKGFTVEKDNPATLGMDFKGIFVGTSGGMEGKYLHFVVLDKEKTLSTRELNYDLDPNRVKDVLREHLEIESEEDMEIAWSMVVDEKNIFDYAEDDVFRITGEYEMAMASWLTQKIRGDMAHEFGYLSVETDDETGVSILVLAGTQTHKIKSDANEADIESIVFKDIELAKKADISNLEQADIRFARKPAAPQWYSKLTRTVENFQQPKAPASQWSAMIRKAGVKGEELAESGILEWLDTQEGTVTKEELLTEVQSREIVVEEVEKGKVDRENAIDAYNDYAMELKEKYATGDRVNFNIDNLILDNAIPQEEIERLRTMSHNIPKNRPLDTKFSSYQLPGGENYKELLLTLPVKKFPSTQLLTDKEKRKIYLSDTIIVELLDKAKTQGFSVINKNTAGPFEWRFKNEENADITIYDLKDETETGEKLFDRATELYQANEKQIKNERLDVFKSSHFDEPNILAHVRFNERTTPEGEKVLFIEEVQSDWHQKGRKKGYFKKIEESGVNYMNPASGYVQTKQEWVEDYDGQEEDLNQFISGLVQVEKKDGEWEEVSSGPPTVAGVPDAPFKKTWKDLTVKRMIRYASENGFDRIAWATGEQNADHYDLSKQIKEVEYTDAGVLLARDLTNKTVINAMIEENEIENYVGKDVAAKLLESPRKTKDTITSRKISGIDLKVGGEGMKAFYDRMLPNIASKLIKRYGSKIEDVQMDTKKGTKGQTYSGIQKSFPVTDQMREAVVAEGQPMFAKVPQKLKQEEKRFETEQARLLERAERSARGKLVHAPQTWVEARAKMEVEMLTFKAEKLEELKKQVYQYGRKVGLHKEAYNRVDTLLKNTKTVKQLEKAIALMDRIVASRSKRGLVKKVRELVVAEQKRLEAITKKPTSTLDFTANSRLTEYLDGITSDTPKKRDAAEELIKSLQDNPSMELGSGEISAIRNVGRVSIDEMTSQELVKVIEDIKEIKATGRLALEQKKTEDAAMLERLAFEVVPEISDGEKTLTLSEKMTKNLAKIRRKAKKKGIFVEKLSRFKWAQLRAENILNWFENWKRGPLVKATFDKMNEATKAEARLFKTDLDKFEKIHADSEIAKDIATRPISVSVVVTDPQGNESTFTNSFSMDEAMFIYAHSQNPNSMRHLVGKINEGGNGLHPLVIDAVIEQIPLNVAHVVDNMIDYYDTVVYDRLNEAFKAQYGIDMPKEHRYFPIMKLNTDRAENAVVMDMLMRQSTQRSGIEKGNIKTRVKSSAPFDRMSYYETIVENLRAVNHFASFAVPIQEITAVLNQPEIKAAMKERNENAYNELTAWVKRNAYGRITQPGGELASLAEGARLAYLPSVLGGNIMTMLKQGTSLALGMDALDNKVSSMSRPIVKWMQNPLKMTKDINIMSEFMANRRDSFQRDFQEMAEKRFLKNILGSYKLKDKSKEYLDKFKQFSMEGIKTIDSVTVNLLWSAKYYEALNETGSHEIAVEKADTLIRNTQPVGGVLNLPRMFTGNALERMFTMFQNQPNQNLQRHWETASRWGEEKTLRNYSKIFWRIALPSAIFYAMSNAFQRPWKDPEGWIQEAARQVVGGIPVFGQLTLALTGFITGTIKKARGGAYKKNPFGTDFTPSGFGIYEDMARFLQDPSLGKAIQTAAYFSGLPVVFYRRLKKAIDTGDWRYVVHSTQALKDKSIAGQVAKTMAAGKIKDKRKAYKWLTKQPESTKIKVRAMKRKIQLERKEKKRAKNAK